MKSRFSISTAAVAVLAALAIPVPLGAQQLQKQSRGLPHYKLTDLGTLGGSFSQAGGLNNGGSVAGFSTSPGDSVLHAFLWQNEVMTDLGTLGGPDSFTGEDYPLNDRGQVTGYSDTLLPDPNGEDVCGDGSHLICLPFVWQKGVMSALPLVGGNNGIASEINNRSQIVGTSETANPDPKCSLFFLQAQAVIWENGQVQELPPLPGYPDTVANAINDNGEAVGGSGCSSGVIHAVLWRNGKAIDLGTLGGATGNVGFDINNKGQVVGQSDVAGDSVHHAFLWTNRRGMQDLGTLAGLPTSLANGLNNKGQVVGFSQDANGDTLSSVAFLWQNGVLTDLNTLIPANSRLFLLEALGINDRGEIAGYGLLPNGEIHGYILIPCDEDHLGVEGCDYSMVDTTTFGANTNHQELELAPFNVRPLLHQRRHIGRFEAIPRRPR